MGEFADIALDDLLGAMEYAEEYPDTEFAREYFAFGGFFGGNNPRKQIVTCKFCNRTLYHWKQTKNGWRLATPSGKIHQCREGRKGHGLNFGSTKLVG